MRLTLSQARQQLKDRDLWLWRREHWDRPVEFEAGDLDDDCVWDALNEVPNR